MSPPARLGWGAFARLGSFLLDSVKHCVTLFHVSANDTNINLRVEGSLKRSLSAMAERSGRNLSDYVRAVLRDHAKGDTGK